MRYVTAGESHGRALVAIVSGVPAGVALEQSAIDSDLARRQAGYGRGGRQAIETDRANVLSGVRFGLTIGSPIALMVSNRDWDNWTDLMSPFAEASDHERVTNPRPGHADLAGILRNGSSDVRDILERASARETAVRVASGGVAKAVLACFGVTVKSFVTSIGSVSADVPGDPGDVDSDAVESSRVRCPDESATTAMIAQIDAARSQGESLGGVFTVTATGLVAGVGSYVDATSRLDARLAAALVSIPAIKGVEFGLGFGAAALPGSAVHDEIVFTQGSGYSRRTNRAGGLEGGMTNGETLVVHTAMKPIPTLMRPLHSVDIDTHEVTDASKERSDVCAVPAAAVVGEAEVAMVLADAYLEAFGSTNIDDAVQTWKRYCDRIAG